MFLLVAAIFFSSFTKAQDLRKASLDLSFPSNFVCDSIWVGIKNDSDSKGFTLPYNLNHKEIRLKNVLSSAEFAENDIRIFLFNNNFNFKDTLYFLSKDKNAKIVILDNANKQASSVSKFKLVNVFNFDELNAEFSKVLQLPFVTTDRDQKHSKERGGIYNNINVLNFISENLSNPYSLDLFTHFVVLNPLFDYVVAKKFYDKKIERLVRNPNQRAFIEKMLVAKTVYSKENVPAPNFSFVTLSNDSMSSSSLKGRYVMINFWATWCGPCKEEFPKLKSLIQQYKNKNLTAISVSMDKDFDAWKAYVKENDMTWMQVGSHSNISTLFGVNPIPQIFVINPDGLIVYNSMLKLKGDLGLEILEKYLAEHLVRKN